MLTPVEKRRAVVVQPKIVQIANHYETICSTSDELTSIVPETFNTGPEVPVGR
jgi:hypothetical protein